MLADVANQLENEKKQLLDLEARYAFAGDIDTSLQVCKIDIDDPIVAESEDCYSCVLWDKKRLIRILWKLRKSTTLSKKKNGEVVSCVD